MTNRVSEARRRFLENLIAIVPAILVAPLIPACTRTRDPSETTFQGLPEGVKPAREGIGTAKALQYHHDATDAPISMRPGNSDQFCHNCQHFTAYEDSQFGKCGLITEGAVNQNGWCNAWVAKTPA